MAYSAHTLAPLSMGGDNSNGNNNNDDDNNISISININNNDGKRQQRSTCTHNDCKKTNRREGGWRREGKETATYRRERKRDERKR